MRHIIKSFNPLRAISPPRWLRFNHLQQLGFLTMLCCGYIMLYKKELHLHFVVLRVLVMFYYKVIITLFIKN